MYRSFGLYNKKLMLAGEHQYSLEKLQCIVNVSLTQIYGVFFSFYLQPTVTTMGRTTSMESPSVLEFVSRVHVM